VGFSIEYNAEGDTWTLYEGGEISDGKKLETARGIGALSRALVEISMVTRVDPEGDLHEAVFGGRHCEDDGAQLLIP
jgi:hypothetical protein